MTLAVAVDGEPTRPGANFVRAVTLNLATSSMENWRTRCLMADEMLTLPRTMSIKAFCKRPSGSYLFPLGARGHVLPRRPRQADGYGDHELNHALDPAGWISRSRPSALSSARRPSAGDQCASRQGIIDAAPGRKIDDADNLMLLFSISLIAAGAILATEMALLLLGGTGMGAAMPNAATLLSECIRHPAMLLLMSCVAVSAWFGHGRFHRQRRDPAFWLAHPYAGGRACRRLCWFRFHLSAGSATDRNAGHCVKRMLGLGRVTGLPVFWR